MQYIERAMVFIDSHKGQVQVLDDKGERYYVAINPDTPVTVSVAPSSKEEDK